MQRSMFDQATEIILSAKRPLLVAPSDGNMDSFSAMVALSLIIESMRKEVSMVCAAHVPQALQFLPGSSQVREVIKPTREIVVDVPLGNAKADHVGWEQYEGGIRLLITPERGTSVEGNIVPSLSVGRYPWDIIISLGASNLERIGRPFSDHAPFFYETPILNIDRGGANELFGAVNVVAASASTVSEVVHDLGAILENKVGQDTHLFTKDVATALYAGLVAGTHSFRMANTTPRTLMIASRLLEHKADQSAVTHHLFHAREVSTLRLIGRGMARLKSLEENLLWTILTQNDFRESEASPSHIRDVLEEITERTGSRGPAVAVFERRQGTWEALLFPGRMNEEDRERIAKAMSGSVDDAFILTSLEDATKEEIEHAVREHILPHIPHAARA